MLHKMLLNVLFKWANECCIHNISYSTIIIMENIVERMNLVTGMNKKNIYYQNIRYKYEFLKLIIYCCITLETAKQGHWAITEKKGCNNYFFFPLLLRKWHGHNIGRLYSFFYLFASFISLVLYPSVLNKIFN